MDLAGAPLGTVPPPVRETGPKHAEPEFQEPSEAAPKQGAPTSKGQHGGPLLGFPWPLLLVEIVDVALI